MIPSHQLDFESCPWPRNPKIQMFRVGTCHGQWGSTEDCYYILTVINDNPGNGHINDVFEWFEASCKRDKKNLIVLQIFNDEFKIHLLSKRDFIKLGASHAIKVFNRSLFRKLLQSGNSMISKKELA